MNPIRTFVLAAVCAAVPFTAAGAEPATESATEPADPPKDAFFEQVGNRPLGISLGQWNLAADLQVRPRAVGYTGRDFVTDSNGDTNLHVTQRSRLGLTAAHESGFAVRVLLQDVRVWGEAGNNTTLNNPNAATLNDFSAEGFDLQEAYIRIPVTDLVRIHLGRQEINFDNQRILGSVDWSQRARALDSVRVMFALDEFNADFVYAKLMEDRPPFELDGTIPDRDDDADFIALHAQYTGLGAPLEINASYYLLDDGQNDLTRHTVGTYLKGKALNLNYDAEFYYEFGNIPSLTDGAEEDISAWMVAATLGYTLPVAWKPNITGRFEALSGDGTAGGAFDPFFGTNHKFYGEADYFLVVPAQTGFLGLMDPGFIISAQPLKGLHTSVNTHFFLAMEENAAGESYFGTEVDVVVAYQLTSFLKVRGVYGPFFPGEAMRFRSGAPGDTSVGLDVEHFGFITLDMKL